MSKKSVYEKCRQRKIMCFSVELTVDTALSDSDIEIYLDNHTAEFSIVDRCVEIQVECSGFFHILELKSHTNKRFRIEQVKVGDCDLRKLLFLSYMITPQGRHLQPATELWEADQRWILPFGYPVSGWLSTVERKIPNGKLGQNLLDHYYLYYPQSIKLENTFPQIIRDFFQHNFDFTVVEKSNTDIAKIPWLSYNKDISLHLVDGAKKEINDNIEFIMSTGMDYGQREYNIKEFESLTLENSWHIVWLRQQNQTTDMSKKFPKVCELIDSLGVDHWHAFIGLLPPSAFIYPHCDLTPLKISSKDYDDYRGCTQLYIPLHWPSNNFMKFAGVGILSFEHHVPMVINNDYFTHCLVNAGDQNRIVLGVRCHKSIVDQCDYFNPTTVDRPMEILI